MCANTIWLGHKCHVGNYVSMDAALWLSSFHSPADRHQQSETLCVVKQSTQNVDIFQKCGIGFIYLKILRKHQKLFSWILLQPICIELVFHQSVLVPLTKHSKFQSIGQCSKRSCCPVNGTAASAPHSCSGCCLWGRGRGSRWQTSCLPTQEVHPPAAGGGLEAPWRICVV